jgi:hypothetical protein
MMLDDDRVLWCLMTGEAIRCLRGASFTGAAKKEHEDDNPKSQDGVSLARSYGSGA